MQNLATNRNRALALAGVVQAAALVKRLAWNGSIETDELATSVHSIFQIHAPNVTAIYGGGIKNLQGGLQTLIKLLAEKSPRDPEIARYTVSLLHLERTLIKNPAMLNTIQKGIERAKIQAQHFSSTHENVIANLAGLYLDTISTLKFRIHVSGENNHLSNNHTINKVRVILLAGVRSAVLWNQLGGSRWQLVFGKRSILQEARALLETIENVECTV